MIFQLVSLGVVLIAVGSFLGANLHERHYEQDGVLYRAMHLWLPGYATSSLPEHTVDLEKWVGSQYAGLTASVSGVENPEVTASLALRAIGIYGAEYELRAKGDGHYVLYKPKKTEGHFSWSVPYRVWRGTAIEKP